MRIQDYGRKALDFVAMPFRYFSGRRDENEARADGISRASFSAHEPRAAQNNLSGRVSSTFANLPGIRQIINLFLAIFCNRSEEQAEDSPFPNKDLSVGSSSSSSSSSPPLSQENLSSVSSSTSIESSRGESSRVEIENIKPTSAPEREEELPDLDAKALVEKKIPDDGACMFHAVRNQLGGLMTYLLSNHLMNDFGNKLPDDMQLRLKALAYMHDNYNKNHTLKDLIDLGLKDYNDRRIQEFGEEILNFTLLFSDVDARFQNNHYKEITRIMQAMLEDGVEPQLDNLKREVVLYKATLNNEALETKQLVETLERTLDAAKPASLETYFEKYKDRNFFANRDALYALSQILRVDFHIYQHFVARGSAQPGREVLLKAGDPRSFVYCTSEDDNSLHDQMAPVAYLAYRNGNHYNVLVRP